MLLSEMYCGWTHIFCFRHFLLNDGHGLFGHHISKWKNDVDQTCQGCLEEEMETAWHLWSECPALTSTKQSLPQGRDVPMEVVVLRFFKTEPVKELMELRTKSLV